VILNNLFSNAYKFQKDGFESKLIRLSISVKNKEAIITVEDNGIGIDEKYQTSIFNLFERAIQKNVGSGPGLYMVKESVSQIGGEIKLNSEIDQGSSFIVILPA
jgi:two-component system sensor histidine kinase/response regulator